MKLVKTSKVLLLCTMMVPSINAMTLKESIQKVIVSNPEIIAEKNNQKAFRKYIDEREANYLPRIDVDGRIEKSKTKKRYVQPNRNNLVNSTEKEDGYNVGIALNQILYDGNLTPSRIIEAKHNYAANNYRTQRNIDNVVLETITAYTDLIKYKELLDLTKSMIDTNEENLQIAKEKESISGEVLETYQVSSKLSFVKEKYFEEEDLKSSKRSTFKRYVGVLPSGNECRPQLDLTKIPETLEETVKKAVLQNTEILEQIERIKAQREKIAQADSKFLPNLGLELKAVRDKDLSLNEEGVETQAYGRLNLTWNLFNGGGDYAVSKQEEFFLAEQKQRLDAITNKIVESIKVNFQRIQKNKKRITVLKQYVQANENIVSVYKDEFDSGTRTFVDILDAQTVLYEAKKSLINREYELYSNYYELLNKLSMLTNTILSSEGNECSVVKSDEEKEVNNNDSSELDILLEDEEIPQELNNNEDDVDSKTTILEESVSQDSENSKDNVSFLDAPENYYTLNITTTKGLTKANNFIKANNLYNFKAYTYEFGPKMDSAKVIYGVFKTAKEAKEAIKTLPKAVRVGKPYVDNLSKHQKLYKKYH
ncbi:MAG: TolC family protein [Arcobacter sp.]|nr:TolC family protein [Arcobacter sp.]